MNATYKKVAANIYSFKDWVNTTDPNYLKEHYEALLLKSGFTLLQFSEHHFEEQGYTCFWLLGESHLAIHTFPESNTTYVELSSCNEEKLAYFKNNSSH